MSIAKVLCVVGCLVLGVAAACHAYEPDVPATPGRASGGKAVNPVNDLLTKLEALKPKKDAIELEERPLLIALKKEMKAQQERMAKLGIVSKALEADYPTPLAEPVPLPGSKTPTP